MEEDEYYGIEIPIKDKTEIELYYEDLYRQKELEEPPF